MTIDIEDIKRKYIKTGSDSRVKNLIPEELKNKLYPMVTEFASFKHLDSYSKIHEKYLNLRKKFKCSPKRLQMGYIYQELVNQQKIQENAHLSQYLKVKSVRVASGVTVISIVTSPYPEYKNKKGLVKKQRFSCKHDCFYCPQELNEDGSQRNPRSYLSDEPAVARGLECGFDASKQFDHRAQQYIINGHLVDKIEIIVLGGTWTEYPKQYQKKFIRDIFYSANIFYSNDIKKRNPYSLLEEQKINQNASAKIIGLTLEMRPDSISLSEIKWLRELGCTRIQLGIQHIDNNILKGINRGCNTKQAIESLKMLKEHGFKVDAHWMPDLPNSSPKKDKKMFDYIINTDKLQFDQWKVYPTAVVPWTKIFKWFKNYQKFMEDMKQKMAAVKIQHWFKEKVLKLTATKFQKTHAIDLKPKKYIPYTDINPDYLINMLKNVKTKVPPWIRLNRVIRDIPNYDKKRKKYIYAGNAVTNLRQVIHNQMKKEGKFCKCIRCREVRKNTEYKHLAKPIIRRYQSSNAEEYFISMESGKSKNWYYENNNWYNEKHQIAPGILYGFVRLRLSKNSGSNMFPILQNCALVRELHVYGEILSVKHKRQKSVQHYGFGKKLMNIAEKISYQNQFKKIAVISGVGVRNYYKKQGYSLIDTYMVKYLPKYSIYIISSFLVILISLIIAISINKNYIV